MNGGPRSVKRFDSKALYDALDTQRKSRDLSWREVAAEIGVSAATISRTKRGGRMEVDGMLAMVSWLGHPVERFVRELGTDARNRTDMAAGIFDRILDQEAGASEAKK